MMDRDRAKKSHFSFAYGTPIAFGRDGLADKAREQQHREHIGQREDELHRDHADERQRHALQPRGQRVGEREEQAGAERRPRFPFAKNQRGEREVALARRHVAHEARARRRREIRARPRRTARRR